jgi:hypothetical protein
MFKPKQPLDEIADFYEEQLPKLDPDMQLALKMIIGSMRVSADKKVDPFTWARVALHVVCKIFFAYYQQKELVANFQSYCAHMHLENMEKGKTDH